MTTENRAVMSRWMRESMTALEQLRREQDHHEHALEAAMEAIRVHTQAIERVERDIAVIETALASTETETEPERPRAEDEFDVGSPTQVHVTAVQPPRPPPLRPVALARAVGQS
jgi:uncharacterized coiled-coil DUF342 family protein